MQYAACSMHAAPCHRCPWWLVPDSRYHGLDRFQVRHLSCKIASIGFGADVPRCNARLSPLPPPCPDHPPKYWPGLGKCSKTITISPTIHVRSFISSLYVIARWEPEMIFHPWSLRHSSFGISLWWLHIAMIVSRRLELVSILPPMCTNDWPVIAWHLNLSITGVLGVAWSGLNWRYLHSLWEPCCKSEPQTGSVVNCNSYFQFRHCMSPIKFYSLRKQFQFRSPWLAFFTPFLQLSLIWGRNSAGSRNRHPVRKSVSE